MKRIATAIAMLLMLVSCEEYQQRELIRREEQKAQIMPDAETPSNIGILEYTTQEYDGHQYVVCTVSSGVYCGHSVGVSIVHSPDCPCHNN